MGTEKMRMEIGSMRKEVKVADLLSRLRKGVRKGQ
jgi:hypothetical protein